MDLYYMPASAPCRSIQITAEALGVPLNLKFTNLFNEEHLTPAFLKINPQHTVPTLVDNGFSLWESRAVCMYLVEKYGKDDSLYPKDPKARAIVNQRLFFDMGTLYQRFSDYYYPMIFRKQEADPEKFAPMEVAMGFLDIFLGLGEYAAGNTMTIADFALMTTISTYDVAEFDRSKYTNITRWYELCKKTMPGWEMNLLGAEEFRKFF